MQEVKRCPFCDSLPNVGVELYESFGSYIKLAARVECPRCHVRQSVIFQAVEPSRMIPFYDYINAFDAVINKWNKRPTGKWVDLDGKPCEYSFGYCSECGSYVEKQTRYCAECGCEMEGLSIENKNQMEA